MSAYTSIEYADSSVNPVMGCEGCELWKKGAGGPCYALNMIAEARGSKGYPKHPEEPTTFEGRMEKAISMMDLTGKKRDHKPWLDGMARHIFVSDMGDQFGKKIPWQWTADNVVTPMKSKKGMRHRYYLFTKCASNMAGFIDWYRSTQGDLPSNVIWIVSVTSMQTIKRLDTLLAVDGILRGVSYEPALGPVNLRPSLTTAKNNLDWCVAGQLSGRLFKKPFDLDWIRDVRDTCEEWEIGFFLKQFAAPDGDKISVPKLDGVFHLTMPKIQGDFLL